MKGLLLPKNHGPRLGLPVLELKGNKLHLPTGRRISAFDPSNIGVKHAWGIELWKYRLRETGGSQRDSKELAPDEQKPQKREIHGGREFNSKHLICYQGATHKKTTKARGNLQCSGDHREAN